MASHAVSVAATAGLGAAAPLCDEPPCLLDSAAA